MTEKTEILQNHNAREGERESPAPNRFGLTGIDHAALPSNDVPAMAQFLHEVLGGEIYYAAGFDDTDREMGRSEHIFMHIGDTLVQFASPADGIVKIGTDDFNSWPHWAFGVTAEGLHENVERLRSLGIPVFGPVEHRGALAVSAYFAGPEGHKFELVTYDPAAVKYSTGVAGAPGVGRTNWPKLFHTWPNL